MEPFALPADIYASGLVFLRVGAMVMLLPGISDGAVPPRVRLALALLIAMCVGPLVRATLPAIPATVGDMGGQVIKELLVGLMLGTLLRMMLSTLAVCGEVVSLQTTLSFAQTSNPLEAQPSAAVSSFLALLGVVMVFSTGLHHLFIGAIVRSYAVFPPMGHLMVNDAGGAAVQVMGKSFALGIQMSAPVLVFSLVFNLATGLVGRMMPAFQIFFVATPLSVLLGLAIFTLTLGGGMLVWLQSYRDLITTLL